MPEISVQTSFSSEYTEVSSIVQDKKKRDFVQTFFLATQEKGYYVLNDQFRYLREKPAATPQPKEAKFNNEPNAALQVDF